MDRTNPPTTAIASGLSNGLERDVLLWFNGRILPITKEIADRWGVFDGDVSSTRNARQHSGRADRGDGA